MMRMLKMVDNCRLTIQCYIQTPKYGIYNRICSIHICLQYIEGVNLFPINYLRLQPLFLQNWIEWGF